MKRVYFIKPIGMDGPIKIGCSIAPDRRRSSLELWSPFPLEIVAEYEGGNAIERRFHAMFASDHVHHEWFNRTDRLVGVIKAIKAGTFDLESLPPPQQLPRKAKDLSYITPEWRAKHSEQVKGGHAFSRRLREASQGTSRDANGVEPRRVTHHARPSGQFSPIHSAALSPKEVA